MTTSTALERITLERVGLWGWPAGLCGLLPEEGREEQ